VRIVEGIRSSHFWDKEMRNMSQVESQQRRRSNHSLFVIMEALLDSQKRFKLNVGKVPYKSE